MKGRAEHQKCSSRRVRNNRLERRAKRSRVEKSRVEKEREGESLRRLPAFGEQKRAGECSGENREEKSWTKIKMHTHRADCVSERRPPPRRPEPHSTAMSQGLPSVDTHSRVMGVSAYRCDWQTHRRLQRRGGDGKIAASSHCSAPLWPFLSPFFCFLSNLSNSFIFKQPYASLLLSLLLSFWLSNPSLYLSLSVHHTNGSILSGMGYGQQLLKV